MEQGTLIPSVQVLDGTTSQHVLEVLRLRSRRVFGQVAPACVRVAGAWRHVGPLDLRTGPPATIGRPRRKPCALAQLMCVTCSRGIGPRMKLALIPEPWRIELRTWTGQLELGLEQLGEARGA